MPPGARKRWAPSRHSGDSSLSPKEPSSSETRMSASMGACQWRMSAETICTCAHKGNFAMFKKRFTAIGKVRTVGVKNPHTSFYCQLWECQVEVLPEVLYVCYVRELVTL